MRTITFYAYKGGTGRTLALTKAARFLAEDGKKVFVLDLDLEAPGLHFKLLDEAQRDSLCPGFVELAHSYVADYYFTLSEAHVVRVKTPSGKGEILLMPAGKALSGDYWKTLTRLNWQDLFGKELGDGVPLFLELKDQIEKTFAPDFLLIDARTGITEVGGAALTLLPDDVVCLFSNNLESLWGTREAIRAIDRTLHPTTRTPVHIVPVLARFPPDTEREAGLLEDLLTYLNEPVKEGEPPAGFERVFVLHSYRELEVDEQSELGQEGAKGRFLAEDYDELFGALGLKLEALVVDRAVQEAMHAAPEAAFVKWSEALDRLLKSTELKPAEIEEGLDGYAAAYTTLARYEKDLSRYEKALPLLRRTDELEGATPRLRTVVAQHLAVALARLKRFEEISPRLLSLAQAHELEEASEDEKGRALRCFHDLRAEYEDASASSRYRSYETIVLALAELLEAAGNAAEAEDALRSGILYFEAWGDEGLQSIVPVRRRLADLLKRTSRLGDAEAELRRANEEYARFGRPLKNGEVIMNLLQEDLASVMDAQNRPEAAEDVRRSLKVRAPVRVPVVRALPTKRPLLSRAGPPTASFEIPLGVVTPLLGGAPETREIDSVDVIRAPSIRGHLRFWWRALHGGRLAEELYARERQLWGGAGDVVGGRSTVEIRVTVQSRGESDHSNVLPYGRSETPGAYALWPARETRGSKPQPVAPRRKPGTRFLLGVTCRAGDEAEVRNAIRAWILFGGYGGRTRRGAGSLTVEGTDVDRRQWLPADGTREALRELFVGQDILEPIPARDLDDLPLLAGAGLRVGPVTQEAATAWTTALHWLRDFRQKPPDRGPRGSHDPGHARDPGDNRPGRSNWPEADKVRRLSGPTTPWAHTPRHNATPAWPRAGFGLPIVAQFQRMDRNRAAYPPPGEPGEFELRWRERKANGKGEKVHDRLASPLIVKALPLADGRFLPCALWLYRGYPANGEVILDRKDARSIGSEAPFDRLVAQGDTAQYAPLQSAAGAPVGTRLRKAFFDWLTARYRAVRTVAP